ncbi:Gprk1, partial [Symbiodinium microadriaticum]
MPAGKRAAFAQSIAQNYLLPTSRGRKDSLTARHPSHLYRINSLNRGSSSVLSVAEDTSVHANALQLTGNDVQEVLDIIGASSAELSDAIKRLANESTGGEGLVCDMSVAPLHEKAGPVEAAENAGDVTSSALFDKLDASIFSRLKNTHRQGFTHSQYYDRYIYTMIRCEKPVTYDDFVYFRTLGRGGFGLVNGCKKTESGQLYAIKQMDRKRIKKKNAANLCINERKILEKVSSPFIVCMQYAFTTPSELYIILDLMVGGDLAFHLHQKGFFTAQEVQYYTARTVLGIKALHDIGVVYRDLKPENILMDYK